MEPFKQFDFSQLRINSFIMVVTNNKNDPILKRFLDIKYRSFILLSFNKKLINEIISDDDTTCVLCVNPKERINPLVCSYFDYIFISGNCENLEDLYNSYDGMFYNLDSFTDTFMKLTQEEHYMVINNKKILTDKITYY